MAEQAQVIPEGYKQTEVGIIPNEWLCVPAHSIVDFFGGFGFSSRYSSVSGIRWLKIANVGINEIKWDAESYLPERFGEEYKTYLLAENDIVMALTRPILDNKLKIARVREADLPALLNQRVARLEAKNSSDINYLYYVVQRSDFIAAMNLAMAGSDPPNIGTITLGQINIASPSNSKEQTAIANALSDVDALISELEKLIAKKQAIKTATMQQLLTGKTRLPEFALHEDGTPKGYKQSELGEIPEDWEVSNLSSVCASFKTGKLDANAMVIDGEYRFYTCAREYSYIDTYAFDTEALLVSGNGANVGYVHYFKGKFNAYQRTYVLSGFSAAVSYLKIYLERKLADRIRVEVNAGNTPYITMDTLTDMPIVLPSLFEEQVSIGVLLSDMDEEIQTLQQRLNKTRHIKQGMMQELLTGKTRLIKTVKEEQTI